MSCSARLLSPAVYTVRAIKRVTGCRTWHVESAFVAAILVAVIVITKKPWTEIPWLGQSVPVEWIIAFAVFRTFSYMTVATRLQEAEERRSTRDVECHKKLVSYLIQKETAWCLSFILLGAWSALVGVFVFLLYPWWRKNWLENGRGKP